MLSLPTSSGVRAPARSAAGSGRRRRLTLEWPIPHDALSWGVVGGGRCRARRVVVVQVESSDLGPHVEPRDWITGQLGPDGVRDTVVLLTSRDVRTAVDVSVGSASGAVRCVATVGMGNALRVGDPPTAGTGPGTINIVCALGAPVREEALVEAMAIVVEARTTAVLEAGVPSTVSGASATGTGTDCVVVLAPCSPVGASAADVEPIRYVGKHTATGSLLGQSVLAAVRTGLRQWSREARGVRRGRAP